ncbi:unnamed protein product [Rodentolepis nana]|uniref:Lipase_3 domain-containing protein n=1 Tax=Rodentolepis nana TaxID=102285 RepID=A0A158QGV0_RODNA|nr:unnamed protein product [Rodentolepis nana]
MSISEPESHPAFYHSKKRIWDFPITSAPSGLGKSSWRSKFNIYCVGGFDSLWKVWYAAFIGISTSILFWLAIVRYQVFKSQSLHPRFGLEWNWGLPLNLQVACLVIVITLFPLMVYAAVSRVGHSANDGIVLGRDCLHLHAMLAQLPCFRLAQRSADPEAAERLRARIARSTQSLNETSHSPDFESFIIQERRDALEHPGWCAATRRQLRPFACLIHVIISFALLLPIAVFEAEQIRNEAMPPKYVWHSNLDWLLNSLLGSRGVDLTALNISVSAEDPDQIQLEMVSGHGSQETKVRLTTNPYPSIPPDFSPEYLLLATAFTFLMVRFAAPFWFTSRSFSGLLSVYTFISGCYVLLESAAMELLIKIYTAGARDTSGHRIDIIPNGSQLVTTWICVITSAIGFLALIAGLIAFYSFGELLFQRAVTNYANLIMAGEFDIMKHRDTVLREDKASTIMEETLVEENDLLGPSVIAVTTKIWRPVRKSPSALGNASSRIVASSALSASNDTLRSKTGSTRGTPTKIIGKSKNMKSSITFWPSLISALSFGCLAFTRSCLFGPMLQCYWHTKIKLPLIYVIFSILYLILWLVLWFGMTVKTAWRFRLLHMPVPNNSRYRFTSPKSRTHAERMGLAASQFAPWPLMNNPAAAQLGASYFWPWLQYQNGFIPPQNGSLAFGASPTPFEGTYVGEVVPNGINSMYECYNENRPANPGGLLRDGPPTLSDESDNVIQLEYDRPSNFGFLQKGAGLVTICDGDKQSEESYQPYKKHGTDPAYVSLASLGRTGSPQRSTHGGSRRGVLGARVTFKADDENGGNEGNNASSDSGVCTNGSGSRIVGRLNLSNHPLFIGATDRAGSPGGFINSTINENPMNGPVRLESDERLCSQV